MAMTNFDLQGVETRAADARRLQANLGPQMPGMHNGVAINQPLPKPPAMTAPAMPVLPAMQAAMPMMAAPAPAPMRPQGMDPRGLGANSPLGGFDPRPLSMRGPMGTGQRGVGTTNPNAFRVGPQRRPGERQLMQAARRGDVRAAGMLYGQASQEASEGRGMSFEAQRDAARLAQRNQEMMMGQQFQQQQTAMDQAFTAWRDSAEAQRRAGESGLDWDRRQQAQREQMQAEAVQGVELMPVPGLRPGDASPGAFAVMRTGAGLRQTGGGMITPPAPPPAVPAGLVPVGMRGGEVEYGTPAAPKAVEMPKFETDKESGRLFYVEPKEGGGFVRRFVEDADGDGVPDAPAAKTPAAGAARPTSKGRTFIVNPQPAK
jgi:hypothetical protein